MNIWTYCIIHIKSSLETDLFLETFLINVCKQSICSVPAMDRIFFVVLQVFIFANLKLVCNYFWKGVWCTLYHIQLMYTHTNTLCKVDCSYYTLLRIEIVLSHFIASCRSCFNRLRYFSSLSLDIVMYCDQ